MTTTRALPGVLRWAVRLLWVEAVFAGLLAVLVGYRGATTGSADLIQVFASAGFVALIAAGLAGLAAGLTRRKPRARAPAIVLQLFGVMFGYLVLASGAWPVGIGLAGLGIAVATLLLAPGTGEALGHSGRRVGTSSRQ